MGSVAAIVSVAVKTVLDENSMKATNNKIVGDLTNAGNKAGSGFLKGGMPGIATMAKSLASAYAVKKVIDFGKESINAFKNTAMEAANLQRVAGGTIEDMSRLNFAAKESGISTEKLGTAFKFLSKSYTSALDQQDAATGKNVDAKKAQAEYEAKAWKALYKHKTVTQEMITETKKLIAEHAKAPAALGKNAAAFGALGISLKDSQGKQKDLKDLLLDTAEAFKNLPAGADKSALAMKLFGRSGLDLLPFLNRGKTGITAFMKEADKFGMVIGKDQVDAVKANALAQRQFHEALEGVKVAIGSQLFPVVTKWMTLFRESVLPNILKATKFIKDHGATIAKVALIFGTFAIAIKTIISVQKAWNAVQTAFNIISKMNPYVAIGLAIVAVAAGLIYAYKHFKDFRDFVQGAAKVLKVAFELAFGPVFLAVKAFEWIAKSSFGKAIGSAITKAFKGKAEGGPVLQGHSYLVGERGPEIFKANTSGTIIPNNRLGGVGGSGDSINIVVNNPKAELSSVSIPIALRRLTYLKGTP